MSSGSVSTTKVSTSTSGSVPRARVITERCGHLGLLARELAAADQLADQRVVVGQLVELLFPDPVGARVADVTEGDLALGPGPRAPRSSSCPSRRLRRPHSRACRRGGLLWISSTTYSSSSPPRSGRSWSASTASPGGDLACLRLGPSRPRSRTTAGRDAGVLAQHACGRGASGGLCAGSLFEPQICLADLDHVARRSRRGCETWEPFRKRSVRRADVLEPHAASAPPRRCCAEANSSRRRGRSNVARRS